MAAVRQGCPPLLGVLQHQFQPFPEPLAGDCSRAFALAPDSTLTNIQWPVKVYTLHEDQQGDNQGLGHVIQLYEVAEGHVPASQGLTKCGPPEKEMANHFSIPALRTP